VTHTHTHTHTTVLWPSWTMSGTTQVSQHQKGKTNLDLLEQEIVSCSGISWAICKYVPWPRHNYASILPFSFFTGQMLILPPNQQRQNTEGRP